MTLCTILNNKTNNAISDTMQNNTCNNKQHMSTTCVNNRPPILWQCILRNLKRLNVQKNIDTSGVCVIHHHQ